MVELTIESIRVSLMNYQRVVVLKEKDSDRFLPIWIGPAEADSIAVQLQEVSVVRPLTHDLLKSIIGSLNARVESVVVNDLSNDTFYARIVLETGGKQVEIDSRPSDAIALAVRVNVPIYAEEAVLERAGIYLDRDATPDTTHPEAITKVDEAELERMSAFRDFINTLDVDDLGKQEDA